MPRKYLMSWSGKPNYRWRKMHKGVPYTVTCEQLKAPLYTQEATGKLADEWWRRKLAELEGGTPLRRALLELEAIPDEEVASAIEKGKAAERIMALKRGGHLTLAEANRILGPLMQDNGLLYTMQTETEQAVVIQHLEQAVSPTVAVETSVGAAIDEFLMVLRQKDTKAKTYQEIEDVLKVVRGWWGNLDAKEINEAKITAAWGKVAEMTVGQNSKKKRWNIVRRFVGYLDISGRCPRPRNLNSPLLTFKVTKKKIKTWPVEVVRAELAALPDRFRMYALMGLNCGMINSDISALTKSMVVDGVLTRKRVKTKDVEDVPTVSYQLWPETLALMEEFKSADPVFWFTARSRDGRTGAPLVDHRLENGKVKTKDLIASNWQKCVKDQPIPLQKFRSVASTKLGSHKVYGRFAQYFLGQSPESVADTFYVEPSQELFDEALDWLRVQFLG